MQDFTRNIRAVSGGGGLILDVPKGAAGLGAGPRSTPVANTGRSADLDAIATYLALGVRAPISPVPQPRSGAAQLGRAALRGAGLPELPRREELDDQRAGLHAAAAGHRVVDAQLVRFLCRVGTFDPALFTDGVSNEIRANNVANVQARGVLGFNVPSLISVFASAPYLHSGAAPRSTTSSGIAHTGRLEERTTWIFSTAQRRRVCWCASSSRSIAPPCRSRRAFRQSGPAVHDGPLLRSFVIVRKRSARPDEGDEFLQHLGGQDRFDVFQRRPMETRITAPKRVVHESQRFRLERQDSEHELQRPCVDAVGRRFFERLPASTDLAQGRLVDRVVRHRDIRMCLAHADEGTR